MIGQGFSLTHHFTLFHYWRSSASWRVRWALAHKGLDYTSRTVNLLKGEQSSSSYSALNPASQVPALVISAAPLEDDEDMSQHMVYSESMAIMEFLEDIQPSPRLLPVAPLDRLKVRQLSLIIVAGTQPLQNLQPQKRHSSDPVEQKAFARFFIERGLRIFEAQLRSSSGSYCVGGELSMADLCLVPQVYNALRYDVDMAAFPQCHRIYHHCLELPSCQKAMPENQPQ